MPTNPRPSGAPADGTAVDVPGASDIQSRRGNRKVLLAVIAITLIGCGAVVYNAFAPVTAERLDATSQRAVVAACRAAYDQLSKFGPLPPTATPADRAALTERENSVFSKMADTFAAQNPPDRDGLTALRAWTSDWRTLIERRADYATELRTGAKNPELVLPLDGGAPITNRMNKYARTHDAVICATHNLQAEIVDGLRAYPDDPTESA